MTKEDLLEMDGTVLERLPDARYRVRLDNGHETMAYMAGRVKKNRIWIFAGYRVTLEMTPYDLGESANQFPSSRRARTGSHRATAPAAVAPLTRTGCRCGHIVGSHRMHVSAGTIAILPSRRISLTGSS